MRFIRGNLLEAEVEALVNAVNTVGVMGKGIALAFKQRFPENFTAYAAACGAGEVQVGRMFVHRQTAGAFPRWIINFPTKKHWRDPTRIEWVETGLVALAEVVRENQIRSIALPALGCGNGGLDWDRVRPKIEAAFSHLPEVEALVFEPLEASRP
jgi:O-acetyl-ADP-ribose deacetylase (regulator of RNase III)